MKGLPDAHVRGFVRSYSAAVSTPELRDALPARCAEQQILLHLPAFSAEQIANSPDDVAARLRTTLRGRFADIAASVHRSSRTSAAWRFGEVDSGLGLSLQREIHYLHCPRQDSVLHYGAHQRDVPGLYLAFSRCDRDYLWCALIRYLSRQGIPVPDRHTVMILTRVTATCDIPKNLVSATVGQAVKVLRARFSATTLCLTAVNPFLGFDGASMKSSGFVPFALSPMTYQYGEDSLFTNRRAATGQAVAQRLETPPIVWSVKPVSRPYRRVTALFEGRSAEIRKDQYDGCPDAKAVTL